MGDIYKSAQVVYCWLGPEAGDSDWLFDQVRERHSKKCGWGDKTRRHRKEIGLSKRWYKAWIHLYERSYWSRPWVVQEIILARQVILFCGTRNLTWDQLTSPLPK